MVGIYKIVNLVNNKVYVGSATDIKKRWRDHKWYLRHNKHHNSHLQSSWNKYGENMFEFSVLFNCSIDVLLEKELFYINELNCFDNKLGYNVNDPEHTFLGRNHTEKTKAKLSFQKIGNKNPMFGKCGDKHHNYNKQVSVETRNRMSLNRMGLGGRKGEKNPVSKLKECDIINIRKLYNEEHISQLKIAKQFNVCQAAVSGIISGKRWSHIM